MDNVGKYVKAKRKGAGLTQVQLAEALGWSQSRVCDIETGRLEPRLTDLQQLAAALELSPATLARLPAGGTR